VRILFLQKRLILPAHTGGKIRTHNVLKHLARWNEITYLSNLLDEEIPHLDAMREMGLRLESIPWNEPPRRSIRFALSAVANFSSQYPLNVNKDYDVRLRRRAQELLNTEPFDLLVCDFVQMARNAIGLPIPSLLFQHNVEAEIFERQAEQSRGPLHWYFRNQAAKMRRFEAEAGKQFDHVVAVSLRDQERFESDYGWGHVSVIDTAVDIEYFQSSQKVVRESNQVVFVGSMDWLPNVEGVIRFVQKIWTIVRQQLPDAIFTVVGRNPPRSVRSLRHTAGVEVTGTVPDIRPYLHRATVGIVPLYSGGGTRLKIFEMMASRCPVLSTKLGAEGLALQNGEQAVLVDNDQAFTTNLINLLQNREERKRLATNGEALVLARFTSEIVAQQFQEACQLACAATQLSQ